MVRRGRRQGVVLGSLGATGYGYGVRPNTHSGGQFSNARRSWFCRTISVPQAAAYQALRRNIPALLRGSGINGELDRKFGGGAQTSRFDRYADLFRRDLPSAVFLSDQIMHDTACINAAG
jgi:hypothetical protein